MPGSRSRSIAYRFVQTIARVIPRPSEIHPILFGYTRDTLYSDELDKLKEKVNRKQSYILESHNLDTVGS